MSDSTAAPLTVEDLQRMAETIKKIEDVQDTGMYAKMYVKDVGALLRYALYMSKSLATAKMVDRSNIKQALTQMLTQGKGPR